MLRNIMILSQISSKKNTMRKTGRIWLLTMLLLTFSHFLFGQNNPLIDSLKTELKKHQSDTAKIRLLLAIAEKYSTSDTKNALAYIAQARKILRKSVEIKVFEPRDTSIWNAQYQKYLQQIKR